MDRNRPQSTHTSTLLAQVLVAIGAVAAGVLARWLLASVVSPDALLVFVFSVIVGARAGGLVSGLLATAFSLVLGDYLFRTSLNGFHVPDVRESVRLALFLVEGSTLSVLFHLVRRSEAAERHARDQLRQFLAVVSHELRNPLSAIAASASVVAKGGGTQRATAVLLQQVEHLNRMVTDLADLSRLERTALEIRRAQVSVNSVLESAADVARPEFAQRDQIFQSKLLPVDASVIGDVARLRQVFANLMINASRYSSAGSTIRLHATKDDVGVVVTVSDNGCGFAPEELPHLFQPFVRGTSQQPGTGLGLAICKALVERHGGTISGESAGPDCGATFRVTLPLADSVSAQRSTARAGAA
jgi:signal transduction histidine kinase